MSVMPPFPHHPVDAWMRARAWREHPLTAFAVALAVALILACLLAPWATLLVQSAIERWPALRLSDDMGLARVLGRLAMVFGLAGVVVAARRSGAGRLVMAGFQPAHGWWRDALVGTCLAVGTIAMLNALFLRAGVSQWVVRAQDPGLVWAFARALRVGVLVALIEEVFFRGMIHRGLRGKLGVVAATTLSSAFYAALHFFDARVEYHQQTPGAWSGFVAAVAMVRTLVCWEHLAEGLGLFLLGVALATAFERTGRLYLPIALHAGWVFAVKLDGYWITRVPEPWALRIHGSSDMIDGWPGQVMLLAVLPIIYFAGGWLRRKADVH